MNIMVNMQIIASLLIIWWMIIVKTRIPKLPKTAQSRNHFKCTVNGMTAITKSINMSIIKVYSTLFIFENQNWTLLLRKLVKPCLSRAGILSPKLGLRTLTQRFFWNTTEFYSFFYRGIKNLIDKKTSLFIKFPFTFQDNNSLSYY